MINSIPTIESKNKNVFGSVTKKVYPNEYWLLHNNEQPDTMVKSQNESEQSKSKTIPTKKIMVSPDEARKTNNIKAIGFSVASVTVLTAAGLFFLFKGGTKGLSKNFRKLRDFFDNKLQASKLETSGNSAGNKAYIYMVKTLDNIINKFEPINNFTTIKDLAFKKLMFNTFTGKYTGKLHEAITSMFERIGRQSVVNSYKITRNNFATGKALSDSVTKVLLQGNSSDIVVINGIKQTKAQWLSQIALLNKDLERNYNKFFSDDPLRARYYRFKKAAEGLKAAFSKMKIFWSKDVWKSFMAESAMAKEKHEIQNIVRANRRMLSYSLQDVAKDSDEIIMRMTRDVSYKDVSKIGQLRAISSNIRKYVKNGTNAKLKENLIADIDTEHSFSS